MTSLLTPTRRRPRPTDLLRATGAPSRDALTPEDEELERAWRRIVAEDDAPVRRRSAPRTMSKRAPRSRVLPKLSRWVLAATAILSTLTGTAVVATGAYFTNQTSVSANSSLPAAVKVSLKNGSATSPTWTATGMLPLSAADAAVVTSAAKGVIVPIQVSNDGSVPSDWSLTVKPVVTNPVSTLTPYVRIALSTDGGQSWSVPVALDATVSASVASTAALAAGGSASLAMRFFLDASTPNSLKDSSVSYTISAKVIQAGIPMNDPNASFS